MNLDVLEGSSRSSISDTRRVTQFTNHYLKSYSMKRHERGKN